MFVATCVGVTSLRQEEYICRPVRGCDLPSPGEHVCRPDVCDFSAARGEHESPRPNKRWSSIRHCSLATNMKLRAHRNADP